MGKGAPQFQFQGVDYYMVKTRGGGGERGVASTLWEIFSEFLDQPRPLIVLTY